MLAGENKSERTTEKIGVVNCIVIAGGDSHLHQTFFCKNACCFNFKNVICTTCKTKSRTERHNNNIALFTKTHALLHKRKKLDLPNKKAIEMKSVMCK